MPRQSDARRLALEAMERLLREQGFQATGLAQILAQSGAPKGSFYFHFPEGKDQLAAEALAAYGERVRGFIEALAARHHGDAAGFIAALCRRIGQEMEASGFRLGCAVQNVANELLPGHPRFAAQIAAILAGWIEAIAAALRPAVGDPVAANAQAAALLAALQGARLLARVQGGAGIFDQVAEAAISRLPRPR